MQPDIIQITAVAGSSPNAYTVYGLGKDQMLYQWSFNYHKWEAR